MPSVSLLTLLLLFSVCTAQVQNTSTFQVGVILDLDSLVGRIGITSLSLALSDFNSANPNATTRLALHVRDSNGQVIDAASSALNLLKDVQVDVIIGPQKSAQASFVIGLGERANVPIISFSATSPSLLPQAQPPYFIQAALGDSAQVGAVAAIVEYFKWSQVVIINEGSDYGNGIIPSLPNALHAVNVRISHRSVIPITATDDYVLKELYQMKTMQTRVFLVHVSTSLASRLFVKAKEAGMMTKGYAWIVTSGVMDLFYSLDSHVIDSMEGVVGVKPVIRKSARLKSVAERWRTKFFSENPGFSSRAELSLYGLWAYDATWALAMAAERVLFREWSTGIFFNSTDPFTIPVSRTGRKIRDAMSDIAFEGVGGNHFHLVNGQLEPEAFQILNVVGNGEREVGIWSPSHGILTEGNDNVSISSSDKKLKSIVFPGESTDVPRGWEIPVSGKKLRIGVPVEAGFAEFVKVVKDPVSNASIVSGCFIDMFDAVMKALPYAVPFEYFPFQNLGGSVLESYDEFCRQVSLQNYDGAVGDISITLKRSKYIDFTLPFTSGGVIMIMRKTGKYDNSFFLKPFKTKLWLTTVALFILIGLALWILEHRFNGAYRGDPANHTGMIFYFPFMSLVYAQREKIVNNFARLVVVVWMFVVFILISTYTANLSAILTAQRLEPDDTDAYEFKRKGEYVGCRKGSFIYDFLQEIGFKKSKIKLYGNPEDINQALINGSQKGGIAAFFSVKKYGDLFLAKYRKHKIGRHTYPGEGYAFVFGRGSPLVADISRAIIELRESGRLSDIEGQLNRVNGGEDDTDSYGIELQSFEILFAVSGTITATCVLVFLAKYLYNNRDFINRISNSNASILSKVRAICKHFDQRDPKSFRSSKSRSEEGENTLPIAVGTGNPCSSTVVPVSCTEINDAKEQDTSCHSQV